MIAAMVKRASICPENVGFHNKTLLFYDHILLQAYFRPLIWNFDTFYDPLGYFRFFLDLKYQFLTLFITLQIISGVKYQFLTLFMNLRAISDLF
jgi:hypothetical protein